MVDKKTLPTLPLYEACVGTQYAQVGIDRWAVSRLIELAKDLPEVEVPIVALSTDVNVVGVSGDNPRGVADAVARVMEADLSYPILLDERGTLLDGRHRLTRAIYEGHTTIKIKRFTENPAPCATYSDGDD